MKFIGLKEKPVPMPVKKPVEQSEKGGGKK